MAAGMPMIRATNSTMSPLDHPVPPETFLGSAAISVWTPALTVVSLSKLGLGNCPQAFPQSSSAYLLVLVQQDVFLLCLGRRQCLLVTVVLLQACRHRISKGRGVPPQRRGVTNLSHLEANYASLGSHASCFDCDRVQRPLAASQHLSKKCVHIEDHGSACLQGDFSFTSIHTALALPRLSNIFEWHANRNKRWYHNGLAVLPCCPLKVCLIAFLPCQSLPCCCIRGCVMESLGSAVRNAEGPLITLHMLGTRQLWRQPMST
ncbi:hypothetical protein IG631_00150 [Alternaria alternata]|nr:hypothetical protein IG631_00150 [Alternaria alternata]